MLKVLSTKYLTEESNQNAGNFTKKDAFGLLFGSLFVNFVYFIFIIVAIGIIYPVFILSKELAKEFIFSTLSIIFFKNTFFNMALLGCLVYKIIEYVRDFIITQKHTLQTPLLVPTVFSKQNLVLHLTILLGVGSVLLLHHADFGGKYGLDKTTWADDGIGIVMIVVRLGFELYELQNSGKDKL